ncbi:MULTISPECIES: sugar ABC transporter permease [Burkholderiaceae]|uniref:carbohydrate ABC transporter permease n=1 Tax=Burkholderiaceae TaxID=119060 RepID=UPI0014240953|nr:MULTISPECIES: sugar ABC transporter permease [Burkholderiaceae]NIF52294.1 sugar ABC transporter permease [Burkholderia sp. Ax-1724]NIF79606.1 sugar ABC transporter permease [Paraburkholderia sp. Cy-641]
MGSLKFRWEVVLYIIPALLLYGIFFVLPFAQTIFFSFTSWNFFGHPAFVGLANYARLFTDGVYMAGLYRIGLWAVLAIVFKVGIALVLASLLRGKLRGHGFFETAFFIPVVISSAAISLLFTLLYDKDAGLINEVLRGVGLGKLATSWLSNSHTALFAVIAVPIWHTIGYFFVILLAAMHGVSPDLYDAAKIDGARGFRLFRSITVPSIMPALQVCIVLAISGALKSFDYVFVMTRGGPGTATQVPATWMYQTIFGSLEFGYGTAIATSIFLIGLCATLATRKVMAPSSY